MIRFVWVVIVFFLCACTRDLPHIGLQEEHLTQQPQKELLPYAQLVVPDESLVRSLASRVMADTPAWFRAIDESLSFLRTRPNQDQIFHLAGITHSWTHLAQTLEHLQKILPVLEHDPLKLHRDFLWYKIQPDFLVTGYYEPELEGSLEPDSRFSVPIWGLPATLRTVDLGRFHPRWKGESLVYQDGPCGIIPFYTRHEIDGQDVLANTQRPIAWAKDTVDVFFLHIQGSGRLRLPDGQIVHVLYAGKNGHEYVSLGKIMLDRGLLSSEEMSMQGIRNYLHTHPDQVRSLLDTNPSYVFFRLDENGPLGAMGRALTPMVSVATDSQLLPLGTLLALNTTLPESAGGVQETALLTLAQDRGGAIKKTRLDLFCGAGTQAEFLAGHLKSQGQVYLLLKKQDAHE